MKKLSILYFIFISLLFSTLFFSCNNPALLANFGNTAVTDKSILISFPEDLAKDIQSNYPVEIKTQKIKSVITIEGDVSKNEVKEYQNLSELNNDEIYIREIPLFSKIDVSLKITLNDIPVYSGKKEAITIEKDTNSIDMKLNYVFKLKDPIIKETTLLYFDYDTSFDLSDYSYSIEILDTNGNPKTIDLVKMGYISAVGTPKDTFNINSYSYDIPLMYTGPVAIQGYDISKNIITINSTKIKVVIAPIGDLDFNGEVEQLDSVILLKGVLLKDAGTPLADYLYPENVNEEDLDTVKNINSKFGSNVNRDIINLYFDKFADLDFNGIVTASDASVILKFILEREARLTNNGTVLTLHEYLEEQSN